MTESNCTPVVYNNQLEDPDIMDQMLGIDSVEEKLSDKYPTLADVIENDINLPTPMSTEEFLVQLEKSDLRLYSFERDLKENREDKDNTKLAILKTLKMLILKAYI